MQKTVGYISMKVVCILFPHWPPLYEEDAALYQRTLTGPDSDNSNSLLLIPLLPNPIPDHHTMQWLRGAMHYP